MRIGQRNKQECESTSQRNATTSMPHRGDSGPVVKISAGLTSSYQRMKEADLQKAFRLDMDMIIQDKFQFYNDAF